MSHMCRSEALLSPPERLLIFVHTEEVRGSKPRSPTLFRRSEGPSMILDGASAVQHTRKNPNCFRRVGVKSC